MEKAKLDTSIELRALKQKKSEFDDQLLDLMSTPSDKGIEKELRNALKPLNTRISELNDINGMTNDEMGRVHDEMHALNTKYIFEDNSAFYAEHEERAIIQFQVDIDTLSFKLASLERTIKIQTKALKTPFQKGRLQRLHDKLVIKRTDLEKTIKESPKRRFVLREEDPKITSLEREIESIKKQMDTNKSEYKEIQKHFGPYTQKPYQTDHNLKERFANYMAKKISLRSNLQLKTANLAAINKEKFQLNLQRHGTNKNIDVLSSELSELRDEIRLIDIDIKELKYQISSS